MASAGMGNGQARPDDREQNAFLRDLRQFHQSRGTPFKKVPRLNGRDVNLFQLYNEVTSLGGWRKVNESQRWDTIVSILGLPKACANANLALKQFYIRYLDHYEKIHFLGEDPDDDPADSVETPARKIHNMNYLVPLTYNQQQHEVSDALRNQCGLSTDFICSYDYEKIMLSLLSGLPNEVDFALNVCTLLSNEGKHTLHLEKVPRLIDFLIANTGVWTDKNISLRTMLLEKWSKCEGRHMEHFWNEMITNVDIRELYLLGQKDKENLEDFELFSFPRHLGVRESEGQRVLQIATILWNLSFEDFNIPVLASSPSCLKFLLLCAFCKWSCLRQIGLDILGNIAMDIMLDNMGSPHTQVMFRTITLSLLSTDRFLVIRGLEILAGLCRTEGNEDIIIRHLDKKICEQMCNLLTIHDIMLLIYTLECLYYLTELGHEICNSIACIHKVVEVLVSLITVEAQSYGSSACIAMKVIETAIPVQTSTPLPVVQRPQPTTTPSIATKPSPLISAAVPGYQEADNDTFASNWLKAYYEWNSGSSVLQNDVYVDYQTTCNKLGKKGLIPPSQLINLLKTIYPQLRTRPSQVQNVRSEIHLEGIKRRLVPLPVSIYMPTRTSIGCLTSTAGSSPSTQTNLSASLSASTLTLSSSPILKAQLSAPPRTPSSSSSVGNHPHLQQALLGKSQPSAVQPTPATPPLIASQIVHSKDSTLIKSLLANKVNQNMLLRQQQLQQSPTMSNGSSTTSDSCIKMSISAACQKADEKKNITAKPSSLRASVIVPATLGKDLALKTTPIRPKSPKSRVNGLPRSLNMEMCTHGEPAKDLTEDSGSCETNIERIENHVFSGTDDGASRMETASDEPTLDKLLRGVGSNSMTSTSSSQLQNGLKSSLNGSFGDSPKFLTMEASPATGHDGPVRRKGVLADLLEGKVHKDAFLSMNGIVDRSDRVDSGSTPIIIAVTNVPSTSTSLPIVSSVSVLTGVTTVQTSSIITSKCVSGVTVVGSNCNSIFAVKSSPLTNGEGILAKPLKIILPLSAKDVLKPPVDGSSKDLETFNSVKGNSLNGNSSEKSITSTVCVAAGDWSSSPSASKVIVPPRLSDSEELIGFPRVSMEQLNQLRQQVEMRASNKRPSIEPAVPPDGKRARMDERTTVVNNSVSTDSASNLPKDEKFSSLPILTPSEAQQQVSAVLQGSFGEKGGSHSSTHVVNSARKHSMTDTVLSQAKSNSKKDVCGVLLTGGSQTSKDGSLNSFTASVSLSSSSSSLSSSSSSSIATSSAATLSSATSSSSKTTSTTITSSLSTTSSATSTSSSTTSTAKKLDYICEWKGCLRRFESPMAVFVHACKVHAPEGSPNIPCQWESCDHMTRQRLSLMTHLQDRHCNDHMLRLQATRRQQLSQMGSTTIPPPAAPSPHPGYAPNAAVQAIRRHALEFLANKELTGGLTPAPKPRSPVATLVLPATKTVRTDTLPLSMLQDEKEGPVTKSIRLTAALILRNLVMYSSLAKSFVKRYEAHLSVVAMSNVESSRTVAQCLWELNKQQDQQIH